MRKFNKAFINDCYYSDPNIYTDDRGLFLETYRASEFTDFLPSQTNCSISKKGTIRGIHRTPYAKLVTCVKGKIYDVCIDLRPDSKTYNQYFGIHLDDISFQSLYIPPYCGHAFFAIEDSIVIYHQEAEYNPSNDETYCYCNYNIKWPSEPLYISEKDHNVCE